MCKFFVLHKMSFIFFNDQKHRIYVKYNNAIYDYVFLRIFCFMFMYNIFFCFEQIFLAVESVVDRKYSKQIIDNYINYDEIELNHSSI